jgi:regulator of RNase E activity RraA
VHLVDIDCLVTVHGLTVSTNDIVHMDQHGAVKIPADAVKKIPTAIDLISRREQVIIEAAQAENFDTEKLKSAIGQTADIH